MRLIPVLLAVFLALTPLYIGARYIATWTESALTVEETP